ncbi:MAG: M20/M25/M40 family metallo-hydrolase [Anaerolineaceae bacterium]
MTRPICICAILLMAFCCCNLPALQAVFATPTPTPTLTPIPPTSTLTTQPVNPTPTLEMSAEHIAQIEAMLALSSVDGWMETVKELSGVDPVTVFGKTFTINSRYSVEMFLDETDVSAMDYLKIRVEEYVPEDWIEIDPYLFKYEDYEQEWYNLIVTIPGTTRPDEEVLLTAHMDSATFDSEIGDPAPGADDNASGVAALMEALKVITQNQYERTVKIIFFSGEEQGLLGSAAYVEDHDISNVDAVINLDVISYDPNDDHCADLHVGTLSKSEAIGQLMMQVIKSYNLDLQMEYFTDDAINASDHASFWEKNVGAVMVSANLEDGKDSICEPAEFNPYMHTTDDIVENIDPTTGYELTRLAIISAIELAGLP